MAGATGGLRDISFTVGGGEQLAVLGPSGVGKTTLLRALAGLAPVTSGRVVVRGTEVTTLPPERRDVVYLHQTPVLFEHLSVAENVAFPLRVRRVANDVVRERVTGALAAVRLPGLGHRAPHMLSGGQRHRVALARALVARPAVLLLDEPLSALDPALRDEVREAIADVHAAAESLDRAPAMVLVTHDVDDAGLLADRVAVLLKGGIAQLAPPAALFARPATLGVARLLGTYQTIPGRVRAGGAVECALGTIPNDAAMPIGAPVVVAFRRDALTVRAALNEPCAVTARVVGIRHRAHAASVVLRLESAPDAPVLEAALHGAVTPGVGELCGVALDRHSALVFPA
ncbi:MAG: ABC transporter ATP-binding protein [Gemmatimonadaceae bacterium]|nr:ABC transporter ATP-binding protein [Gemmatimonadaceae bacterium]